MTPLSRHHVGGPDHDNNTRLTGRAHVSSAISAHSDTSGCAITSLTTFCATYVQCRAPQKTPAMALRSVVRADRQIPMEYNRNVLCKISIQQIRGIKVVRLRGLLQGLQTGSMASHHVGIPTNSKFRGLRPQRHSQGEMCGLAIVRHQLHPRLLRRWEATLRPAPASIK